MKNSQKRVSPPARASSRRRRVSACPITQVVLPPVGCLVPCRIVEGTTGVPKAEAVGRSGSETTLTLETLTSEMKCCHPLEASTEVGKRHRQRKGRQARDGREIALTCEASRDGQPLAERYQRKHHSARKVRSTIPSCNQTVQGRVCLPL